MAGLKILAFYLLPLTALILMVWVYRDAKKQENMSPVAWAFIAGIAWGLGVIAYLWVKHERKK